MNEQELRSIVRTAIARHTGAPGPRELPSHTHGPSTSAGGSQFHASHGLYLSLVNASDACVIEPAVPCNHCNYCRSHGH